MTATDETAGRDGHCGARKKRGAGRCTQTAGWGTDHVGRGPCKLHGGSTPNHRRKAELERAAEAVQTFGLRRDIGPEEALLEEVQWTAGHVAWLRAQVQELDPQGLTWGLAEERSGEAGGSTYRAGEPVIVKLYREERRHLVDVCRAAAAVGVSERLVRLAEQQGALLAAGLQWLAARLELDERRAGLWREHAPGMLRMLAAGEVPTVEGEAG